MSCPLASTAKRSDGSRKLFPSTAKLAASPPAVLQLPAFVRERVSSPACGRLCSMLNSPGGGKRMRSQAAACARCLTSRTAVPSRRGSCVAAALLCPGRVLRRAGRDRDRDPKHRRTTPSHTTQQSRNGCASMQLPGPESKCPN